MIFIAEVFPLIKQWVNYTEAIKVMIWENAHMDEYICFVFFFTHFSHIVSDS